ncbi:related to Sm-like protein LSm1 [Hanseniaspora guilliermondii]|uniref:Related to Sm-like protein LSm1 n=1 Tax=Hanseniaspora guilliermondii TaxID=56406 RepID=A0A1L0CKK4_9ASCO|nr:related to Sm-like protein LSm1 [Hanseniaspora guilliermondii]
MSAEKTSNVQERSKNKQNNTETNEEEADLYLDQYNFTTTAALVASVDRKVMVTVKTGQIYFGILRTYDHFANLTLEFVTERIYLSRDDLENLDKFEPTLNLSAREYNKPNKYYEYYAERPVGCYLIRGENVVFIGEVDIDKEDKPLRYLRKIDWSLANSIMNKKNRIENRFNRQQAVRYSRKGFS